MKTCLHISLLLALVMATAVSAAQVTSINLAHETGATVLRIDLQGPFQFTHMAEVPKDGKPDRLIVDIVGATHNWGPKEWATLPQCGVSKLRIGQYSSKPEKIVRVVLEMPKAPVYQADSDGKSIKIRLTDSSIQPFAAWTTGPAPATAPVVPAATPVKPQATTAPATASATQPTTPTVAAAPKPVLAKPADSPTSHSTLVQKPATTPTTTATAPASKPAPTVATNDSKPAQSTASPVKPTELLKPSTSSAPVVATQTTKPAADAKPVTPTVAQTAPVTTPAVKSEQLAKVDQFKPQTTPAVTTAPLEKPTESKDAAPVKSDEMTAKPKAPEKPLLAEADDAAGSSTPARQTARFRRSASASAKMKSSLVAEFPQRLVIKYENLGYRDPFATLIDDSRTYDTPFEKRLANVEGLRLVGILESGTGDDRALFQDKRNFSYLLKAGDKVEKGYVLRVEKEKVYFQIFEYGWSRTVALTFENRN